MSSTEQGAEAVLAGTHRVHGGHIDARLRQFIQDAGQGPGPVVALHKKTRLPGAQHELGAPRRRLKRSGVFGNEIDLRAAFVRESRKREQIHALLAQGIQNTRCFPAAIRDVHGEVIDLTDCAGHRSSL